MGPQVSFWAVGQTSVAVSLCGRDVTAPRGPCHHDSECVCVWGGVSMSFCVYKGDGGGGEYRSVYVCEGGWGRCRSMWGGGGVMSLCTRGGGGHVGGGGGGSWHCVYMGRGRPGEGGLVHATVCVCGGGGESVCAWGVL